MSYSGRTRDAYRVTLTLVTGVSTVGALAATGYLAGNAAADHATQQAQDKIKKQRALDAWYRNHPPAPIIKTVWKKRKTATVIDTQVSAPTASSGGWVSSGTSRSNTTHAKPPKPPSAPSSGS